MWTVEHQIVAPVSRSKLWRAWVDVESWSEWDPRCQWVRLNGPFKSGQSGRAKFRGGPPSDYTITSVDAERVFWLEAGSRLVRTRYEHELSDHADGGTEVCQRVTVRGPLAPLLALNVRGRIRAYLPEKLRRLADHAAACSTEPGSL